MKFLIDTNIIFQLEDNLRVDEEFAKFHRLCQSNNCQVLIHGAARDDVMRDKNDQRREISLSKLKKYVELEDPAEMLPVFKQHIKKDNDRVDLLLLTQLYYGYVDYLVTNDDGLFRTGKKYQLETKIISPSKGVKILKQKFQVRVPIHPVVSHETTRVLVNRLNDSFFDSLRKDYPGFDEWLKFKCAKENRKCYLLELEGRITALLIYNVEQFDSIEHAFAKNQSKILKLCTLKVADSGQGMKIGELFLGKMFHYCIENDIEHLFITTFEKQKHLRRLFLKFGFSEEQFRNKDGQNENVLYRNMRKSYYSEHMGNTHSMHPFFQKKSVDAYVVPVVQKWYERLFKDSLLRAPRLFDSELDSVTEVVGNSIQKAYICASNRKAMNAGDIVFFYLSGKMVVEAVGILDSFEKVGNYQDLKELVKKVSVYEDEELENFFSERKLVTVLLFRLVTYLNPAMTRMNLQKMDSWPSHYQTITRINDYDYERIIQHGKGLERFIID